MSTGKKQHYLSINPKISQLKVTKFNTNIEPAVKVSDSDQYQSMASNNAVQKLSIKIDDIQKAANESKRKVTDLKTPPAAAQPSQQLPSWKNYHPKENHHYFAKSSMKSSTSSDNQNKNFSSVAKLGKISPTQFSDTKLNSNKEMSTGINKYVRNRTRIGQTQTFTSTIKEDLPKKEVPQAKPIQYDQESRLEKVVTIDMEMGEENF